MLSASLAPDRGARLLVAVMRLRALGGLGSGNFGHGGRPGQVGGSSETGGGIGSHQPDGILKAIHQADGGFTYHAVSGASPTTGFAVSVHKDREQIIAAHDVTLVTLAKYAKTNRDLLSKPNNYMGGWHNPSDKRVYLDVSTVVATREEAHALGERTGQLAYFDLAHGQSIEIPHVKASAQFGWRERNGADSRRFDRARASADGSRAHGRRDRRSQEALRELGAVDGHPFYGNQWTGAGGQRWKKDDADEGRVLNGVPLSTVERPDFSQSIKADLEEPPLVVPKGKHVSAGIVVTEPDGSMWVIVPHNRYGGYRSTFPKGTVDKGEDLQETAAREVWEESGLVAKITGHLVDVERTTSVARFYTGVRVGGAPWAAGRETHAVKLIPIEGKGTSHTLKNVWGKDTSDRRVLDALRMKHSLRLLHLPGDHDQKSHGGESAWPSGLKKIGEAAGSNPGGLYKDANGQKWYVKNYPDPKQAAGEHVANAVYRAVGVRAPQSALGEGGKYASQWEADAGKTLAHTGLTKENADAVLDGFAADVFLSNWDAVGTGFDNVLVKGGQVTRIDQGGTLLHRAQGAPKPEAALHQIGEWKTLSDPGMNSYYARIFKTAGLKGGDDLGARAVKQIDKIVAARPDGGWKAFVSRVAPSMGSSYAAKVGGILEERQGLLEKKRDELRPLRVLHLPGEHDQQTHGGEGGEKKVKAAPATADQVNLILDMKKAGHSYNKIFEATGIHHKTAANIVFKEKKKAEIAAALAAPATTIVVTPAPASAPHQAPQVSSVTTSPTGETINTDTATGNLTVTKGDVKTGNFASTTYQWTEKTKANSPNAKPEAQGGNLGKYAYFKDGVQVSAAYPKTEHAEAAGSINQGKGPSLATPVPASTTTYTQVQDPFVAHVEPGVVPPSDTWPIDNSVARQQGGNYSQVMEKAGKDWQTNLTAKERAAIKAYTGSSYHGVNAALRQGAPLSASQSAKAIQSGLDKAPAPPPPELVWRGVSQAGAAELIKGLSNGDVMRLDGFQSTSINPSTAKSWSHGKTIFEIKPKSGAYVKVISSHAHEYEFLLPHGAKYAVRGISQVPIGGVKTAVVKLEML